MRRIAREVALQVLFQEEFSSREPFSPTLELVRSFVENESRSPEHDGVLDQASLKYATDLVEGVCHFKNEIDLRIQETSQHWKLDRMATVDRNIIRIAIFEMLFMNPPLKANIAINEAVEIAKKFSTNESAAFINGLLDQARNSTT